MSVLSETLLKCLSYNINDLQENNSSENNNLNNHQFINTFLQYPNMTPAKLSIIVNFENENHFNSSLSSDSKNKKRIRYPLTDEERLKRNLKRRRIPRLFKCDIRRQYMNMLFNVLNSADLNLFHRFLNKYFHPDFIYTKEMVSQKDQMLLERYQTSGLENFYQCYSMLTEISADFAFVLQDTCVRFNPKTKEIVLIANFKQVGTRTKFHRNIFKLFLSHIYTMSTSYFQSPSHLSLNSQEFDASTHPLPKNSEDDFDIDLEDLLDLIDLDDCSEKKDEESSQSQVFELTTDNCFSPFTNNVMPKHLQFSPQIINLFVNSNFFQRIEELIPSDCKLSFFSLFSLFSGISYDASNIFYMYLDEQHRITKLKILIKHIKIEISSSSSNQYLF